MSRGEAHLNQERTRRKQEAVVVAEQSDGEDVVVEAARGEAAGARAHFGRVVSAGDARVAQDALDADTTSASGAPFPLTRTAQLTPMCACAHRNSKAKCHKSHMQNETGMTMTIT